MIIEKELHDDIVLKLQDNYGYNEDDAKKFASDNIEQIVEKMFDSLDAYIEKHAESKE